MKELEDHFACDYNGKDIWDWLSEDTTVPYVRLDLDIPWQEIHKEALAIKDKCVIHREHEGDGTWRSICIHGIDAEYTNAWMYYDGKFKEEPEYKWTWVSEKCPITTEFFKNKFPYKNYKRLRFMWVEPDGYILPHQDDQERCLNPVNISIYNPKDCEFRYKNWGTVPFVNGSAFLVDIGQPHAVWNRSSEARLHIIAHGKKDKKPFLSMLEKGWHKYH
tara:strand:- start:5870 stop:6526 length:657 start_codon:yes stop_codon:yes gene_type:complete